VVESAVVFDGRTLMRIKNRAIPPSSLATTPDELGQAKRARLLFGLAFAGIVLYLILDAVAQSLPPHYSPISQAESDLAVGPYGYVMAVNFINRGVLSLCFLFALALTANSGDTMSPRFRRGGWLFGIWSVGALLLAAFPTDVPATPVSWHGAIHLVVALLAFFGGASGAFYLSQGMAGNKHLARARAVAMPLAYLAVVLFLVEFFVPLLFHGLNANYGGLIERLFLGSVLVWVGGVSLVMLMGPKTPDVTKVA
jgi:hypothetical membrane protein